MFGLFLSMAMVGLPAFAGAYLTVNPDKGRSPSGGFTLVLYAAVLAGLFAWLNPEGKLFLANFKLKMPLAFVVGAALGAAVGFLRWRKG